jgi:hypothetical protein
MSGWALRDVSIGLLSAAIATVLAHQLIVFLLAEAGLAADEAWSMRPSGPWRTPALVNHMFWGSLWGGLFAIVWPRLPGKSMWIKGLAFGLLILVLGDWLVVALMRGQPLLAGLNPSRMLAGVLALSGFGAATGTIFGLLKGAV